MHRMATSERPNWAPDSIDLERPNAARIYDYLLGGAANFAADREYAEQLLTVLPEARPAARRNRAFLRRAVQYCVNAGIRQFLDIGSGIPTAGNVHEIAQGLDPECRVVYVDSEPVAVTHSELLLQGNDRAGVFQADLGEPDKIFDAEPVRRLIDFDQPLALLLVSVLHFVPDEAKPYEAVARYVERLAPGSYLVLSHGLAIEQERADKVFDLAEDRGHPQPGVQRGRADFERFFTGTEIVEPGLVFAPKWHPESPADPADDNEKVIAVGVGRKP
jgi:hypothetical protein